MTACYVCGVGSTVCATCRARYVPEPEVVARVVTTEPPVPVLAETEECRLKDVVDWEYFGYPLGTVSRQVEIMHPDRKVVWDGKSILLSSNDVLCYADVVISLHPATFRVGLWKCRWRSHDTREFGISSRLMNALSSLSFEHSYGTLVASRLRRSDHRRRDQ